MVSAHFICRSAYGVERAVDVGSVMNEYKTGSWVVTEKEAEALVGGRLYLHESKSDPSYFGGVVLGWFWTKREAGAIEDGITFRIVSDKEGKGAKWAGAGHSMAWFSGVVE